MLIACNRSKYNDNKIIVVILFIIYPLLSLPLIFDGIYRGRRYGFVLWAIFMGYVGWLYPPTGDLYRYVEDFYFFGGQAINELSYTLLLKNDYLQSLLFWVLHEVGIPPDFTRFLYNTIGYLLLFSIFRQLTGSLTNNGMRMLLFVVLFLFVGYKTFLYRFPLASIIFIFGVFRIITDRKSGWFILLLSVLLHFSMIVPLTVFVAHKIINYQGNRTHLIILVVLSFVFATDLLTPILNAIGDSVPVVEHVLHYTDGYYAQEYYQDHSAKYRLGVLLSQIGYYVLLLFFAIYFKKGTISGLIIEFLTLLVVVSPFDVIHTRFVTFTMYLLLVYLIYYASHIGFLTKFWIKSFMVVSLLLCIINIWTTRRELSISKELSILLPTAYILTNQYTEEWVNHNVTLDGSPIVSY